jgi:hypothetical protein
MVGLVESNPLLPHYQQIGLLRGKLIYRFWICCERGKFFSFFSLLSAVISLLSLISIFYLFCRQLYLIASAILVSVDS